MNNKYYNINIMKTILINFQEYNSLLFCISLWIWIWIAITV